MQSVQFPSKHEGPDQRASIGPTINNQKPLENSHQKLLTQKMESSSKKNTRSHFSPFSQNTLRVQGNSGFSTGANFYSEKYNMIIACPMNNTIQFYNASTLLPAERRKTLQLDSSVLQVSYCAETNIYLFACTLGNIYAFCLSNNALIKVQKYHQERSVIAVLFLKSTYYAFAIISSCQLSVGNLKNKDLLSFDSRRRDITCFSKSEKGTLLFSGVANGSMRAYRTDQFPKLPNVCSEQVLGLREVFTKIENVMVNGNVFIIASGTDGKIRIWNLVKGKMKLLKIIEIGEIVYVFAYLEKYKMIVTSHQKEYIKFWNLFSGKLEWTYNSELLKIKGIFLMNDKDAIGVADSQTNKIEIVQLSLSE